VISGYESSIVEELLGHCFISRAAVWAIAQTQTVFFASGRSVPVLREGQVLSKDTLVVTQSDALIILESKWATEPDDMGVVSQVMCRVIISGAQNAYRVSNTRGHCDSDATGDEIDRAHKGEPFIKKIAIALAGDAKGDESSNIGKLELAMDQLRRSSPSTRRVVKGAGPAVYLIENGRRRWIPNMETFNSLGLKWEEVQTLPDTEVEAIPKGSDYPSAIMSIKSRRADTGVDFTHAHV